jgi:hypothetical protein
MLLPDKFPPGCKFLESEVGRLFVVVPGDEMFILDERSGELVPSSRVRSDLFPCSEGDLRSAAARAAE